MTDQNLTESEGTLLALVTRAAPITAYQIARVYDRSPVTNFNTSKGKIYPIIRRLKARGLLVSESVEGDGRGTERLRPTRAGNEAVRRWAREILPSHALLEDPLRTRIQSFDLLTREERIEWCARAKAALTAKLEELERYKEEVDVPLKAFVHDGAVSAVQARLQWLDRMLIAFATTDDRPAPARAGDKADTLTRAT